MMYVIKLDGYYHTGKWSEEIHDGTNVGDPWTKEIDEARLFIGKSDLLNYIANYFWRGFSRWGALEIVEAGIRERLPMRWDGRTVL
jgi:hypothetical protein